MAAEIVTIILGFLNIPAKIKQYVVDPIKDQFRYVHRYGAIMEDLRSKNELLTSTRDQLRQRIQAAKDNLHNIVSSVEDWCRRVDQRTEETDRLLADEPRVQNDTCLQGTCSSLKLRFSRSRKATKLIAEIDELLKEHNEFRSHISDPAPVETILETSGTLEFDSRKQKEEEIMSYLRYHSIYMIGVWGMGGVGKTTMAKKIRERASKEKLFDRTAMAVVSQQENLLEIQQQLAKGLGLHFEKEETVDDRATKLYTRLMKEKVLIILDDVWEPLNLELVGIPSQTKLLLTTRYSGVCRSMCTEEATQILELGCLVEGEDFSLFCKHAGHVVHQSNLRSLAMNVASKCKGLPLALKTVGVSLTGVKDVSIWEASLHQLQRSAPEGIDGYLEGVYRPLELSYNRLESDEDKNLFLLCCLFPEDSSIKIENLVHYGAGLRIFSAESIKEARDKVKLIVKRLVSRCLLMDAGDESWPTYVKMHDVIRDMALSIASRDEHKFKVSHDKGLREWPHESYTCISLTLGEAMTFQEGVHCPGLKALLLKFDHWSATPMLPENFLNGMADLTLLRINGRRWSINHVFRLPLSFLSSLTKLRVLLLHNCHFEDTDISFLDQVKDLEILRCRGSNIQELPNEIIDLTKLKLLDMTGCWELKNIAPGVIPALVKLEELRLMGCPIEWERQETGNERRNASLAEVFSLKNLSILEVWIKDLEVISQKMDYSPKLTSYSISIGYRVAFVRKGSYNNPKRMSVCVDERMVFRVAISKLIKDVKELKLEGNGCKDIIELLVREGFVNITSLKIYRLGDVKILVEPMDRVIFPNLRHLKLSSMNELEELCNGHPQVGSFSELKEITIRSCAKLKWVFPLSIAESLCKLESIDVRDCPVVEEVFNGHPQVGSFSELKEITIRSCAKLKWVFPLSIAESLCKLESIDVRDCPVVEEVFNGHPQVGSFSELKEITIRSCAKLKWVFPLSIAESLCKLESIDVRDCPVVEEVFNGHPQVGSFSELKEITISSCAKLKWVFPLSIAESLCKLESIDVRDCPVVEEVFNGHPQVGSFSELKEITIRSCAKLKWVFPLSIAESLCKLESIDVRDCPVMEEVFKESESGITTFKFPNLKNMVLRGLSGLGAWCKDVDAIIEFPSIESLNISAVSSNFKIFGNLQLADKVITILKYSWMDNLGMEIFYGEVPIGFFSAIERLEIKSFHRLRVLFSLVVFKDLINLKKLIVEDCVMLENIVEMENEDEEHTNVTIQKLEELRLSKLPKICYFWPFRYALEFPSIERVSITDCPFRFATFAVIHSACSSSIPKFFGQQVTCSQLKEFVMSTHAGAGSRIILRPLFTSAWIGKFHIESSHNLKTLFSPSIFRALVYLWKLTVKDCMMLEDIVEMEKDEDERYRNNISKISPLKELELSKLPKIRYFGHFSDALEFPSLKKVTIKDCQTMEIFVVVSNSLEFPSLEEVTIEHCPKMETFVLGELRSSSSMPSGSIPERNFFTKQVTCPKLQDLTLEGLKISGLLCSCETPIASLGALCVLEIKSCHNLKSLFTSRMFEGLTRLHRVSVTDCSLFEEVIGMDEDGNENVDEMVVNIPKLRSLELRELPTLRRFSHTRRDLEFSSVQLIDLSGCTEIMKSSFCLGDGSVRISTGVRVEGISDPEFASQFFFPTQSLDFIQHFQEEDILDDGCFMLLSSDLSFTWHSDEDLSVVKGTSNAFFLDGWKKACGKFDMEKLSPGITYEIVFAIMLFKLSYWELVGYDQLETMMGDDKREHGVKNVPRQQWIEILVGELTPSSGQCGDITFSLQKNNYQARVALKCASIRPKRIASDAR